MRKRLLRLIGMMVFRWAWLVGPLLVASVAASMWLIDRRMEFDTSLIAFLPQRTGHELKIREAIRDYRGMEPVLVVIHARQPGQEQTLKDITRIFAEDWLDDQTYFHRPIWRTDESAENFYQSLPDARLIQLLTAEDWEELKRLLTDRISDELVLKRALLINAFAPRALKAQSPDDPLGVLEIIRQRMAQSRGPTRLPTRDGFFMAPDGRSVAVLLYPVLPPENARNADRSFRYLERSRDTFFDRFPAWRDQFEIEYFGGLVDTAQVVQSVRADFKKIGWSALPLAFLLLVLVFRKVEAFFFVFLPPFLGIHWTLALATLMFGGVNAVTAVFITVTAAIGLQFSIHLYHRFTLELYRTKHYYRALAQSYVETARGTFTTALVLAGIFFCLFLTALWGSGGVASIARVARDSQGLGQLGLIIGLCILCNLAACLVTLPTLAALKRALARGRVKHVPLYRFKLERFYDPALQRPRTTIIAMLIITAICGLYSRELAFYPRFASITSFFYRPSNRPDRGAASQAFPRPGRPLIAVVEASTLESALQQNDRLYRNLRIHGDLYDVLSVDSLRTVLPSLQSQQVSLEQLRQLDIDTLRSGVARQIREIGFRPHVYEEFFGTLKELKEASADPRFIVFSLAEGMNLIETVQRYVTSRQAEGEPLRFYITTAIYPREDGFEPLQFEAMLRDFGRGIVSLELIGDPAVERELARLIKFNLAVMILLSVAAIVLALALHFRQWRFVWLTLIPVVASVLWMCGLMAMAGLRIHFFTVLAMPLILSLSLDNALQLTQYYSDRQPCTVRYAMVSVGRVIVLTCAAVSLFYGTFSLMSYAGFRDFGLTVLIGAFSTFAATAMFLPALMQLFGRGQPFQSVFNIDQDAEI